MPVVLWLDYHGVNSFSFTPIILWFSFLQVIQTSSSLISRLSFSYIRKSSSFLFEFVELYFAMKIFLPSDPLEMKCFFRWTDQILFSQCSVIIEFQWIYYQRPVRYRRFASDRDDVALYPFSITLQKAEEERSSYDTSSSIKIWKEAVFDWDIRKKCISHRKRSM